MEVIIILILIFFNGLLALSEIAVISSRKTKLQQLANEGNNKAKTVLELVKNPNEFLSTIQIGITAISILAGVFSGATFALELSDLLAKIPIISLYRLEIAFAIVVAAVTYMSLLFGELIPKRIALSNPEKISMLIAPYIASFAKTFRPVVAVLSFSTDLVTKIIRLEKTDTSGMSEEEIRLLIKEGAKAGIFAKLEKDIAVKALMLGDRKVSSLMTPRDDITAIEASLGDSEIRKLIKESAHSRFPVIRGNIDEVVGIIHIKELLKTDLDKCNFDVYQAMLKPLFIPETMDALKVLEVFKRSNMHMAMVIDEYGNTVGLVTLNDILEAVVGDIPSHDRSEKKIVKRDERSYLLDGKVSLEELKETFRFQKLPYEKSGTYQTLAGLIMTKLDRIPVTGDFFMLENYKFEVVDMDGNRVDKVMATRIS